MLGMVNRWRIVIYGLFFVATLILSAACSAQQGEGLDDRLRLPGEKLVFSFRTEDGKTLSICTSENPSYIVYRYGTQYNVELEYPESKENSWDKFAYYVYARGGYVPDNGPGKPSAAVFLQYLTFINEGFEYTVFNEWNSWGNKRSIGIRVNDNYPAPGKYPMPKAVPETVIGSLGDLIGSECEISYWDVSRWKKQRGFQYKY